ncbi:MAG: NAD(P)/FAD-dependent oxidoreductase [Acidimicrobiales bacterium]
MHCDGPAGDHWTCDLLVIGAGPAGTAAAIEAARRGLDVVLVDKARFPREKCCGDGLTTGALRHLDDLGLDPTLLPSWIEVDGVVLSGPDGRRCRFPLPTGSGAFAAVCRRQELDAALVDLARSVGVPVLEQHEVTAVSLHDVGVDAVAGEITFHARYAVAADGMWSPTRKLLGVDGTGPDGDRYRGEWHAFRQYFTSVSPQAASELIVWFEPDLLPGYAWSFPLGDGSANVGFGIVRDRGRSVQDMNRLWPDLLARPSIAGFLGPTATAEDPHRAWPIPARLGRRPLSCGRVLFAGDAAAATDPLTGEGIGQALETGRLAVRAVTASSDARPDEAAAHYRSALRRTMIVDHALARSLSTILARPSAANVALRAAGATGWTRRNFARWLFEDYPRAALLTPGRWRRGLLAGPAAFTAERIGARR